MFVFQDSCIRSPRASLQTMLSVVGGRFGPSMPGSPSGKAPRRNVVRTVGAQELKPAIFPRGLTLTISTDEVNTTPTWNSQDCVVERLPTIPHVLTVPCSGQVVRSVEYNPHQSIH